MELLAQLVGRGTDRSEDQGAEHRGADRGAEADTESDERAPGERQPSLDDRDAHACDRAELGADHHRPDDQNERVGEDPHGGDQRRDDHERDEGARELCRLGGALLDLLPHDRVGRGAARDLGRPARELTERRLAGLEGDRARLLDPELAKLGEHEARVLARHVADDRVPGRPPRGAREMHDVEDGRRTLEHLEHAARQRLWRHDAQVDHAADHRK